MLWPVPYSLYPDSSSPSQAGLSPPSYASNPVVLHIDAQVQNR